MGGWVEPEKDISRAANLVSNCMLMLLLDCKEAKGEACLLLYLLTTASSNMSVPAFLLVLTASSYLIMPIHADSS